MSALSQRIRSARELRVEAGGRTFIVRRPTDLDMLKLAGTNDPAQMLRFVVGWEGVTDADLIPGSAGLEVPFDADACAEWLADRPDLLGPIIDRLVDAYEQHRQALEDAGKN